MHWLEAPAGMWRSTTGVRDAVSVLVFVVPSCDAVWCNQEPGVVSSQQPVVSSHYCT
jgi:hypothetical protein